MLVTAANLAVIFVACLCFFFGPNGGLGFWVLGFGLVVLCFVVSCFRGFFENWFGFGLVCSSNLQFRLLSSGLCSVFWVLPLSS